MTTEQIEQMFELLVQKELERRKGRHSVLALSKTRNRIELVRHMVLPSEAQQIISEFTPGTPVLNMPMLYPPDPDRLQALIAVWLVDLGIIGAECSSMIRDFENRAANNTLREMENYRG